MLRCPVTECAARVDPGIENGAGKLVILALDRIENGPEEHSPMCAAGMPVTIYAKAVQGARALAAKFIGLGAVLEGIFHHTLAEVLAQEREDVAGIPRLTCGFVGHGDCPFEGWVTLS